MLSIIRYSQMVGLMAIDGATASQLGKVEEIWLDETGYVKYLSSQEGYWTLHQVAGVGSGAVSVYHRLLLATPSNLHHGHQLPVRSRIGEPLGWVEDFLFNWHTGEIVAYLLAGEIATSLGERAVLFSEDVATYTPEAIIVPEGTQKLLKRESEGLKGFLSERSDQVKFLVQEMIDHLQRLISTDDRPEMVQFKIKQVSKNLTTTGEHDHRQIAEATEFLQGQWASLQQSISQNLSRAQTALEDAWKEIISKK